MQAKSEENKSIPIVANSMSAFVNNLSYLLGKQNKIDLAFKWHVYTDETYTDDSLKIALEFRDLYNRLIFAIAILNDSKLVYSVKGLSSDSTVIGGKFEPHWEDIISSKTENYICQVHLMIDFSKRNNGLEFEVFTSEGRKIFERWQLPVNGTNLAQIVAVNYSRTEVPISHNIYDIHFKKVDYSINDSLVGKRIYAFGDSIICGHLYSKKGFVDFLAQQEGMKLRKYAVNGGSILPGKLNILQQIFEAPDQEPDFIIFDGGTNDAFKRNEQYFGSILKDSKANTYDLESYAGNFEKIIQTIKQKWPKAKIIFVAVPRLCSRNGSVQEKLHRLQIAAGRKWNITIIDMFADSKLNTVADQMRKKYTFDKLGIDNLPGTMKTTISNDKTPSGTHPNFLAIEKYYIPEVSRVLYQLVADS
ncbi:MAG: SGNH/GDSL hydrolase family protein [Liquorilactobacillus ghanensis]|uniref:SGNH/GDSL hydrolase family protein n=1 Tax=Liquorilactobacillus ghanensis TaxID=399370 RepID=UPI0039EB69A2